MAFVKESRLTAIDSEVYNTVTWEDISDTWDSTSTRYTDTLYNNTYPNKWTVERYYGINTFESIGGNTDDDIFIERDDLTWDNLTDYVWGPIVIDGGGNHVLNTLEGRWEDTRQVDKSEIIINNQFLKYSWAANDSTWDSLT
jgi:hypothetical protein